MPSTGALASKGSAACWPASWAPGAAPPLARRTSVPSASQRWALVGYGGWRGEEGGREEGRMVVDDWGGRVGWRVNGWEEEWVGKITEIKREGANLDVVDCLE